MEYIVHPPILRWELKFVGLFFSSIADDPGTNVVFAEFFSWLSGLDILHSD